MTKISFKNKKCAYRIIQASYVFPNITSYEIIYWPAPFAIFSLFFGITVDLPRLKIQNRYNIIYINYLCMFCSVCPMTI